MKFKKFVAVVLSAACMGGTALAFAACEDASTDEAKAETQKVSITCLDANSTQVTKEVPYNPQRVAILDYAVLDMIDAYGKGSTVVSSATGTIAYLSDYWSKISAGTITNLGGLKSYDMEKLMQSEPDIIFIGGRQASDYAKFEEIAPVVYLSTTAGNVIEDTYTNARTIAKIFGVDDSVVNEKISGFSARVDALKAVAKPEGADAKTAMVLMYTSSTSISVLSATGRCSLISNEIGFSNVATQYEDSTHGTSISFETIVNLNPDYIFVLNRGYVTSNGANGNQAVVDDLTNSLTGATNALQSGHLIVMDNPDAWYTAEGGLQALDTMLKDLESQLLNK